MSDELVSIIVPIYNIESYLGYCIESLMLQSYSNIEIILVDDGSKDRCPNICDLYSQKDNRIKVIHKENGGLVSARKAGLSIAKGNFIGYVDGDDWVDSDFIETLYDHISNENTDIVIAGHERNFFSKQKEMNNTLSFGVYSGSSLSSLIRTMLSHGKFFNLGVFTYVWNKLFRKSVLYDCQMSVDNAISLGEDAAVTYPAILHSSSVSIIENNSYHYRQREDSMLKSVNTFDKDMSNLVRLYWYLFDCFSSYPHDYNLYPQLEDYIFHLMLVRSGGMLLYNEDRLITVFDDLNPESRVVIYSAGTFGQHLVRRIKGYRSCSIVAWVDDDYREYRRCCLDVDPLSILSEISYDKVLVATLNSSVYNSIEVRLLGNGVPKEKIEFVSHLQQVKDTVFECYLKRSN